MTEKWKFDGFLVNSTSSLTPGLLVHLSERYLSSSGDINIYVYIYRYINTGAIPVTYTWLSFKR